MSGGLRKMRSPSLTAPCSLACSGFDDGCGAAGLRVGLLARGEASLEAIGVGNEVSDEHRDDDSGRGWDFD